MNMHFNVKLLNNKIVIFKKIMPTRINLKMKLFKKVWKLTITKIKIIIRLMILALIDFFWIFKKFYYNFILKINKLINKIIF